MTKQFLYERNLFLEEAQELLKTRNPNKNNNGFNALHSVCEFTIQTEESISLLMHHGTDVNAIDRNTPHKNTPLHILIANERKKAAIFFINEALRQKREINFYKKDSEGKTTLTLAVKTAQSEVALHIINTSLNPEEKDNKRKLVNEADDNGMTPLHYACLLGLPEVADALIKAGADLEARDKSLKKPIQYVMANESAIRAIFKSVSINPDRDENALYDSIRDRNFQSLMPLETLSTKEALNILSVRSNKPNVEEILKSGILDSTTIAHNKFELVCRDQVSPIIDLIVKQNAGKLTARVDNAYLDNILTQFDSMTGRTLMAKCIEGHKSVKDLMIQRGAEFDYLIRVSAFQGSDDLINLLNLPKGKKYAGLPGLPSKQTALHQAVTRGNINACRLLVEAKVSLNPQDKDKKTPLHLAIECMQKEAAVYLVRQDADLDTIQNNAGQTARDLLKNKKYAEINQAIHDALNDDELAKKMGTQLGRSHK